MPNVGTAQGRSHHAPHPAVLTPGAGIASIHAGTWLLNFGCRTKGRRYFADHHLRPPVCRPDNFMKSILLPTIENALEYGYEALQEPDDLYHSLGWLLMDEEIRIARPFSVVCIPDSGGSAIAATWGLVVDDTAFWPFMRIDSVLSGLFGKRQVRQQPGTRRAIRSLLPNAYLGALRGGTTRMPVAPGLDAETTLRAIGEVLDGVEAMASDEGLGSVAFFYVPAEDAALRAALTDRGYLRFGPMHNVSVLQVTTFSDYLGRLSTSRRRNVAWERNKIARAGVRIQVEPLTRELSEDMLPLEAQLYRKYGHETAPFSDRPVWRRRCGDHRARGRRAPRVRRADPGTPDALFTRRRI